MSGVDINRERNLLRIGPVDLEDAIERRKAEVALDGNGMLSSPGHTIGISENLRNGQRITIKTYGQDMLHNTYDATSRVGISHGKRENLFFSQSDVDTCVATDFPKYECTYTMPLYNNTKSTRIQKQETEIQQLGNFVDGLIDSVEKMKRELVNVKCVVEKYKVEYDTQRLNCKTKELEAILLRNENARLKEQLDQLQPQTVGKRITTPGESSSSLTSVSCQKLADLCFDSGYRTASRTSDMSVMCRSKYPALEPILKPKIYRRPHIAVFTDSLNSREGVENSMDTRRQENRESQSYTCTRQDHAIREAEQSKSAPSIQTVSEDSAKNFNYTNNGDVNTAIKYPE